MDGSLVNHNESNSLVKESDQKGQPKPLTDHKEKINEKLQAPRGKPRFGMYVYAEGHTLPPREGVYSLVFLVGVCLPNLDHISQLKMPFSTPIS